jgi:hypothetical protein
VQDPNSTRGNWSPDRICWQPRFHVCRPTRKDDGGLRATRFEALETALRLLRERAGVHDLLNRAIRRLTDENRSLSQVGLTKGVLLAADSKAPETEARAEAGTFHARHTPGLAEARSPGRCFSVLSERRVNRRRALGLFRILGSDPHRDSSRIGSLPPVHSH